MDDTELNDLLLRFKEAQFHAQKVMFLMKERKQFKELSKSEVIPQRYIFKRFTFKDYGSAVNFWVKVKKSPLSEIRAISKDKRVEKTCGLRKQFHSLQTAWELDYFCPLCSRHIKKPFEGNREAKFLELSKIHFSEYAYFLYCENCNVDIPTFFCLNTNDKKSLAMYKERYLEMIKDVKRRVIEDMTAFVNGMSPSENGELKKRLESFLKKRLREHAPKFPDIHSF